MTATVPVEHRRTVRLRRSRSRFRVGWRERIPLIPAHVWLNLSGSGISLTFHLWIASWNTRTGWYFNGPLGFYMRERRGWNGQPTRRERGNRRAGFARDSRD